MDLEDFTCALCWATFESPGELAAHEQEEEDRGYCIA
jgi:hypothetical protein